VGIQTEVGFVLLLKAGVSTLVVFLPNAQAEVISIPEMKRPLGFSGNRIQLMRRIGAMTDGKAK